MFVKLPTLSPKLEGATQINNGMKKEKTIKTYQRRTKSGKLTTVKQHTARYDAAEAAKEALKKAKGAGREFEKGKRKPIEEELTDEEKKLAMAQEVLDTPLEKGHDKKNWLENRRKAKEVINSIKGKKDKDPKKDPITKSAKDKAEAHSKSLKAPGFEKSPKTATKPVNGKGKTEKSAPTISPEDYKAWYHWDQEKDPKNKAALSVEKALKTKMGTKEYNKYFNKVSDEYSSRGHLKGYKSLEPAEHSKIKSAKMRTGTAKAQKEIAEKMGAKDAAAKFDKIAKEGKAKGKAKGKEPFEVFGGVHTKAQMDKIQKDMAEWKTVGGIKKHIDELKKKGHDKKGHTEHPHYLWAVKKLKEIQGGSKSTISAEETSASLREKLKLAEKKERNATLRKENQSIKDAGLTRRDIIAKAKKQGWWYSEGVFYKDKGAKRMADFIPKGKKKV